MHDFNIEYQTNLSMNYSFSAYEEISIFQCMDRLKMIVFLLYDIQQRILLIELFDYRMFFTDLNSYYL